MTSNKSIHDDTLARGVLYQNYDLYDTGGPGPGKGLYQNMSEYKSVDDFRKKKRKEKKRKLRKAMFESILMSKASDGKEDKNEKLYKMIDDYNNLADPNNEDLEPIALNSCEPGGSPIGMLDGIYPEEDLEMTPRGNPYYGQNETHSVDG